MNEELDKKITFNKYATHLPEWMVSPLVNPIENQIYMDDLKRYVIYKNDKFEILEPKEKEIYYLPMICDEKWRSPSSNGWYINNYMYHIFIDNEFEYINKYFYSYVTEKHINKEIEILKSIKEYKKF